MKPDEFQLLASNLVNNGRFPSEFRTAVSRAYYAAFNVGVDLLEKMGFSLRGQIDVHTQVYNHLHNCGHPPLIEAAQRLQELKARRKHADYDLNRTDVEKRDIAKPVVMSAERIIKTLRHCCNGPEREAIRKGIQNWRTAISRGKKVN